MQNITLEGGRIVGPPKDWDAKRQGECLSISVLHHTTAAGPATATAWRFTPEELAAFAEGGALFVSTAVPFIPVQQIWVQTVGGDVAAEMTTSAVGGEVVSVAKQKAAYDNAIAVAASLRAAMIAFARSLHKQLHRVTDPGMHPAMSNADLVQHVAQLVGQIGAKLATRSLPVMTLHDVVRGAAVPVRETPVRGVRATHFTGDEVDEAAQRKLEERLGVELSPGPSGEAVEPWTGDQPGGSCAPSPDTSSPDTPSDGGDSGGGGCE